MIKRDRDLERCQQRERYLLLVRSLFKMLVEILAKKHDTFKAFLLNFRWINKKYSRHPKA